MLIDWFTVSAQALNVLILVWLLKRFLYHPILHAIEERERGITRQLQEADAKQRSAQQERDEFQRRSDEISRQRSALLNQAREEGGAERHRMMEETRKEAVDLRARLQESLRQEADQLGHELGRRTQQEVFAISRKVLTDLAEESLEKRMTDVFLQRLRGLESREKEAVISFLRRPGSVAQVRSAFALPAQQCSAIKQTIEETLSGGAPIEFQTEPSLTSGIELVVNGHKVAWSIGDHLGSLEKQVSEFLEANHASD